MTTYAVAKRQSKRNPYPRGTVLRMEATGAIPIGRVYRDGKVAAGTGGRERRSFYTASVVGGSNLGTRWVTQRQAVAAVIDFDKQQRAVRLSVAHWAAVNAWKATRRRFFPFNVYV